MLHRKRDVFFINININWSVLFRERIDDYSDNNNKLINTFCVQNSEFCNVLPDDT